MINAYDEAPMLANFKKWRNSMKRFMGYRANKQDLDIYWSAWVAAVQYCNQQSNTKTNSTTKEAA